MSKDKKIKSKKLLDVKMPEYHDIYIYKVVYTDNTEEIIEEYRSIGD